MRKGVYLLIILLILGISFGKLKDTKGFFIKKNKDGTYTLRIYLNYQDLSKKVVRLRGDEALYQIKFPLPDRFIPLGGELVLKYVSSPVLVEQRSEIIAKINNFNLAYNRIGKEYKEGLFSEKVIRVKIPNRYLSDYNTLGIEAHQHYTIRYCEDSGAPELWSDIYLSESYVDIKFVYKIAPNSIDSLQAYLYDPKYLYFDTINLVIDPNNINGDYLKSLALLVGSLANIYKYSDVKINVTDKPVATGDNYIVGLESFVDRFLTKRDKRYSKIAQDMYILSNPQNPIFKNIVITGKSFGELKKNIFLNFINRINVLKEYGVSLVKEEGGEKLPPYSAPGFLPTGRKIYLRDLGVTTITLGFGHPPELKIPYKVYPDLLFGDKDKITFYLKMEYPSVLRKDSVVNIYANDVLLTQIPTVGERKGENFTFYAYTLPTGSGTFRIEPALVPMKEGFCEAYNKKNLVITVKEDSYIEIPKATHVAEMPYLEFFASSGYPYSIYGDLQDTAIILTSTDISTISAALKVVYFLSQRIEYPPFYLSILTAGELRGNKEVLDKELIIVGRYRKTLSEVFSGGAIKVHKGAKLVYNKPLSWSFRKVPYPSREGEERKIDRSMKISTSDGANLSFIQMFRSPYNKSKTVMLIYGDDTDNLKVLANRLFNLRTTYYLKGDTLIYLPQVDELYSFSLNDRYVVGKAPLVSKVKYKLSKNWYEYLIVLLLLMIALVVSLYALLEIYRRKNRRDAS